MRCQNAENIFIVNPVLPDGTVKLQELLRKCFKRFAGSPTLYIIDDCSATKELTKKKDMLSQLHSRVGTQRKVSGSFRRDIFWS